MGVVTRRSSMLLFSDPTSHYSQRVRIVLAEKDVTVEIEDVVGNKKPEDLTQLNPYNDTPTLVDRDLALYDSRIIMEYLDERFPHPPLLPVYPVARGESRLLMHRIEKDWCGLVDIIERSKKAKEVEVAKKDLKDSLTAIAPIFAEKPYFMSDEFTLVDCCMAPILLRLGSLGVTIRSSKKTKHLFAYRDRLFEREAFQASLSEYESELL
ncbi:MAG: glutathione S-transferase N-terminal domain-containing protein [Pseudomonadota bacterium]